MSLPGLSAAQAKDFGKHWKTPGGIHIFMDDNHYKFAADFATIVLKSFIEDAQRTAAAAAKPKVVIAES